MVALARNDAHEPAVTSMPLHAAVGGSRLGQHTACALSYALNGLCALLLWWNTVCRRRCGVQLWPPFQTTLTLQHMCCLSCWYQVRKRLTCCLCEACAAWACVHTAWLITH